MANSDLTEWVRVDVNLFHNPKIRRAGKDGQLLWLAGLLYAKRMGTDGRIDADMADLLGFEAGLTAEQTADAASRLMEFGLWERTADGWTIHDFASCQETTEERERQRESNRQRQQRYRDRKASEQQFPGFPTPSDVTRDSPVTNGGLTRPESESESESETDTSLSSSGTTATARKPTDDDEISRRTRTIHEVARQRHLRAKSAGTVRNAGAHLRTCIANAEEELTDEAARFYAHHPGATDDQAVAHLIDYDPRLPGGKPSPTFPECDLCGFNHDPAHCQAAAGIAATKARQAARARKAKP